MDGGVLYFQLWSWWSPATHTVKVFYFKRTILIHAGGKRVSSTCTPWEVSADLWPTHDGLNCFVLCYTLSVLCAHTCPPPPDQRPTLMLHTLQLGSFLALAVVKLLSWWCPLICSTLPWSRWTGSVKSTSRMTSLAWQNRGSSPGLWGSAYVRKGLEAKSSMGRRVRQKVSPSEPTGASTSTT